MAKWSPLKSHDRYAMQPNLEIIKDNKDAQFDIVFVHGLNVKGEASYSRNAWTADVNREKIFWPVDLLPLSVPNVRVLLFAYNSSITWNAAIAGVKDHATTLMNLLILQRKESPERPLIFICHSLGGLVVKQALLLDDPKFQEAIKSTRGLVFFATPHRGATGDAVGVGFICADIVRAIQGEGKNPLPELLQRDSALADTLSRLFEEKLVQFNIISVYETRSMKPYGIIVGKTSAVLGLPQHETKIDIDRDHSTICKFPGPENPGYKQFIGHLKLMMDNIQNTEEETRKNKLLESLRNTPPREEAEFLRQAVQLAFWYAGHEKYEIAEELNKRILQLCDKSPNLGLNNSAAIDAAYNRAFALQRLGRYSDSEQLYRRAMAGRQARTGNADDPTVLDAHRQLAEILYESGRHEEAERELRDILERSKRSGNMDAILDCQASLGFLFRNLQRWKDSQSFLKPTFEEMKVRLGPTSEKTLFIQHQLAFVLQSLGADDESEILYTDLLKKRKEKNGEVSLDTLATMRDLAHVLQKKGNLADAEALCRDASSGFKRRLPAGHIEIEWTDNSLAFIRKQLDRHNLARLRM
ncbi:hypothetical protein BDV36DRAFT_300652 [Aspergillus pseudocaelatus]|uniref:DUF676 domain-containing protein n=1 Tax=Aspergillus pseudocaelatus TaxID=1825620 RepID=A0ABQ6W6D2_9EURO|nr:hypothetical protein BDV36DRAFT_300652 [Aspergillus pseudocaelatus]